jgi:hypothetical protein
MCRIPSKKEQEPVELIDSWASEHEIGLRTGDRLRFIASAPDGPLPQDYRIW